MPESLSLKITLMGIFPHQDTAHSRAHSLKLEHSRPGWKLSVTTCFPLPSPYHNSISIPATYS